MRLLLIRHAETASNLAGRMDTAHPGASLTEDGRKQAIELADRLRGETIEAIYVSSLVRTQQTAEPLAHTTGLPVLWRDGLREVEAGEFEGTADIATREQYLAILAAWAEGNRTLRVPGAQSGAEVLDRIGRVIAEIASSGIDCAAVVAHGSVIRFWAACSCSNLDSSAASHPLGNTGVLVVEGDPVSGWQAVSWEGEQLAPMLSPSTS